MKIHEITTDEANFNALDWGHKKFELRENTQNFQDKDILHIKQEVAPGWIGPSELFRVDHIVYGPEGGVPEGWCGMSVTLLKLVDAR